MTSTATKQIEITVNREKAIRDLKAIDQQFQQLGRSAGAMGGAGASAAAMAASVQQAARAATQNTAAMRAMAAATQQAAAAASQAAAAAAAAAAGMAGAGAAAAAATSKMAAFGAAAGGIASAVLLVATGGAYAFVKLSDSFNLARSKIALTASSAAEFTTQWGELQRVALATNSDLSATASLMGKFSGVFKKSGGTAQEAARATETFNKTLKISGTDSAAAAGAIVQLGQAMGSGVLRGDEFNSVAEANPAFMDAMAKALGRSSTELRALAAAGQLTGDTIKKALTDPKVVAEIDKIYSTLPATFSDMFTNLKTAATLGMGELSRALMAGLNMGDIDFAKTLKEWTPKIHEFGFALRDVGSTFVGVFQNIWTVAGPVFTFLGNNLDLVGYGLAYLVASSVALKAANIAAPLVSLASGALSAAGAVAKFATSGTMLAQTTAAIGVLVNAIKASTVAQIAFNIAAMANPYVLLATAAVAAVAGVAYFTSEMKVSENGLATWGDVASTVMSDVASIFSGAGDWFSGIGESASKNFDQAKKSVSDFVSNIDIDAATIGNAFVASTGVAGAAIAGLGLAAGVTGSDISNIATSVSNLWGAEFEGAGNRSIQSMGSVEAFSYKAFAGIGRAIDIVAKLMSAGFAFVSAGVGNAVKAIANGMINIINAASRFLTKFVNNFVDGLNLLIDGANNLGASIDKIGRMKGTQQFGTYAYEDGGASVKAAFNAGGVGAEKYLGELGAGVGRYGDGVMTRSEAAAQRAAKAEADRRKLAADPTVNGNDNIEKPRPADATGGKGGKGGKESPAEAAKRAADEAAKLKEGIDGFWKGMERTTEAAKLTGIELENHNALLKIQDIYKDKWATLDKSEVAAIVAKIDLKNRELATAKAVTELNEKSAGLAATIAAETQRGTLIAIHGEEIGSRMFDQEKARAAFKAKALEEGVDITSKEYLAAQKVNDEYERGLALVNQRNDAMKRASNYVADAVAKADPKAAARDNYQKTMADLEEWRRVILENTAEGSAERAKGERAWGIAVRQAGQEFHQAVWDAGQGLRDQFSTLASAFGDIFGAKIGAATDGLGQVISGLQLDKETWESGVMGANSNSPVARGLSSLQGIGESLKIFKTGGKFSEALGKMSSGAAIGSAIAPIGKMFSKKFSSTGSQIGGAIGGIGGPIGAVAGSIIGGIVGGLFKKAKYGTAVLTGNDSAAKVSGRGSAQKASATGAAGSVQEALANLAAELGGDVGSYNVSIGTHKGKWRVHTAGRGGKLTLNRGATGGFGEGEAGAEAAIRFAIEDAIGDGAITGVAPIISKALKKLSIEATVQFAKDWKTVNDSWAAIVDPVGAGLKQLVEPFDTLRKTMVEVGATVEEMTTLEKYRAHTVNAFFDEQMSGLKDFRKTLFGDGMGVTKMDQFKAAQTEYASLAAKKAAGETIDQSLFTKIAGDYASKAAEVYGTSNSAFQAIRNDVIAATDGMISEIEIRRNEATAAELARQTEIAEAQLLQQEMQTEIAKDTQKGIWAIAAELIAQRKNFNMSTNGVVNAKLV